jgi:hypothetical protein
MPLAVSETASETRYNWSSGFRHNRMRSVVKVRRFELSSTSEIIIELSVISFANKLVARPL